jgi:hypothetical protein
MKPFELSEEIQTKLARLAIANDTVDWSDDDQSEEYTDERASLIDDLSSHFGILIRQLATASLLTVDPGDGASGGPYRPINEVQVDENMGIILKCEPAIARSNR